MQRRWLVVWLAVMLILVGVTSRSGALITLSLPILLYLGAGLFLSPNRIDLDIQRYQNADIVTSGTPVQIKLTCTNLGQPLHEIYIEDQPPPGVKQQSGRCNFRAALDTGEQIDIDYTITGERGIHKFQPLEAVAGDPFWLFPERSSVHVYSQLMAVPVIKSLKRIPIQPQQTRPYPGPIRSRKGGSGTDFFGIREYQTGDPMRWVNWQAAARNSEELYTNLFERENIADAGIIVDARQQTDVQEANGGSRCSSTAFAWLLLLQMHSSMMETGSACWCMGSVWIGYFQDTAKHNVNGYCAAWLRLEPDVTIHSKV
jgi:uncharacterized protein (DUF58 family)